MEEERLQILRLVETGRVTPEQAAELLRQTLQEEQATDTLLNNLAKNYINAKAR